MSIFCRKCVEMKVKLLCSVNILYLMDCFCILDTEIQSEYISEKIRKKKLWKERKVHIEKLTTHLGKPFFS